MIRHANINDFEELDAIEHEAFPAEQACSRNSLEQRLAVYADYFWILEEDGKIVSYVNGLCTDETSLLDAMYEDAHMHNPNGAWQMIFSVATRNGYRKQGKAGIVLQQVIDDAQSAGRKGIVLTCLDPLVSYYAKFGFEDEGISEYSTHGDVAWHQMRLTFKEEV